MIDQFIDELINEKGFINQRLYTAKEVCEKLNVSGITFRKLVSQGLIRAYRLTNNKTSPLRIMHDDILEFLENMKNNKVEE